jgi:hypothetical protein
LGNLGGQTFVLKFEKDIGLFHLLYKIKEAIGKKVGVPMDIVLF